MNILGKKEFKAVSDLMDLLDSNQDLFLDGRIDLSNDQVIERFNDGTWGIDLFRPTRYDMPKADPTGSIDNRYGDGG